ncbi:putative vomeronasal receptor-like protein 4 [Rhynchocyon petersi]
MSTISDYIAIKTLLISQAGFGLSANIFFLFFRIFILIMDHNPKPVDLTTSHLAFIHIVMLLTIVPLVFLMSPEVFESLNFQDDFKCKMLFYKSRVMRSLSICTSCFLSVIQAITISTSTSWLARFKHKFTKVIFHFVFFWFLSLSISSDMLFYAVASSNVTQPNILVLSKYCSLCPMSYILKDSCLLLASAAPTSKTSKTTG